MARVLEVFFSQSEETVPHHTTIRLWVFRNGCSHILRPVEKANDWIVIGDLTIDLGTVKCLTFLGVRLSQLENREDLTLKFSDVDILGLHLTQKCTGEFVQTALEKTRERIGNEIFAVVTDQGAEIKKGTRLFKEKHPSTRTFYDMPHKLSLVVKRELTSNPKWSEFLKKLMETRRLVLQTELAALMPGIQRSKGRYIDVGYLIRWPRRILEKKVNGNLDSIPEERFKKYFGWMNELWDSILDWETMVGAVDLIKGMVRHAGLSSDVYKALKVVFDEAVHLAENSRLIKFLKESINAVKEEYEKLSEGETTICSTEILESAFGKFKEISSGYQGITGNILGMATYLSRDKTNHEIKQVMESCSVQCSLEWVKTQTGKTIGSYRYDYFRASKRTEFDSISNTLIIA